MLHLKEDPRPQNQVAMDSILLVEALMVRGMGSVAATEGGKRDLPVGRV